MCWWLGCVGGWVVLEVALPLGLLEFVVVGKTGSLGSSRSQFGGCSVVACGVVGARVGSKGGLPYVARAQPALACDVVLFACVVGCVA